ncbi:3-deoxy-D-manno-octulosonic acid transferase [Parvularcula dongshanensis]|uniref:3-deoxy-D-manno-octulosonic acid transferase n=1 Tax=Parvularcula dongshanensis TaxID=1173995 RepID=A0A840I5H0_9PROT|nr:3-deoxy-D-manno-octulosonic acid transferase [Parvularcula dongshanensis]MBB4660099.1 3-deoxy-D-manno-octulosonic-acid transferase [Parvularcula dongshanensis]
MTPEPFSLRAYRAATSLMRPVADAILDRRLKAGKEDPDRIGERRGVPGRPRPDGPLLWIHGASVGESLSVLPLIERLRVLRPEAGILVTTGTVTSARLMAERLPPGAFHQYAPIDHPAFVGAFLDAWRPDAGLFVESELWPGLIGAAQARQVPLALVNGRMSPGAFHAWRKRPAVARALLSAFDVILGQDRANASRFAELSGREVRSFGNLKQAAPPLPADASKLHKLTEAVGGRPCWLAASTHPGEEEEVIDAHKRLSATMPDLLTIIAPRHPERGGSVDALVRGAGLSASRRSRSDLPGPEDAIYIADTLGELGLFYRICNVAFIGGSLIAVGGHNPLEPARLGCAILTGPKIFNFEETYAAMRGAGGSALVRNARDLSASLARLMNDPMTQNQMAQAAQEWSDGAASAVLDDITGALAPVLDRVPC